MASFWHLVNRVIAKSDIILEVLDARLVEETRNAELEAKIEKAGKQLIFVLNKCDLASKKHMEKVKKKLRPCVFVSSRKRLGIGKLRETILRFAKKQHITVGVVGYPNTGKSSVINALKGRRSAPTSSKSGFTRALQLVRATGRIMLLDSPGVIPFKEKDEVKHALIGSANPHKLKEPDLVAMALISELGGAIEAHYEVEAGADEEEILENVALKLKKLKKGGVPNIELVSRMIIADWQKGKIKMK